MMKTENVLIELTNLKNWLSRHGFPGCKRAIIALREAIRIIEKVQEEEKA